jgi:putative membrane protein
MDAESDLIQLGERPANAEEYVPDGEWHRLAPLSIISELIQFITRSIIGLIAMSFFLLRDDDTRQFAAYLPLVIVVFAITPIVRWFRFRYSVGAREIRIEQGLFSRSLRIIPMERVHDVALERKPVHRLFGLAKVTIETGGGGKGEEGALDALTLSAAGQLRDTIRAAQRGQAAVTGAMDAQDDNALDLSEKILFIMTPFDLAKAGLFNFSLTFIAVVGAAVNQFDFLIPVDIYDRDFWFGVLGRGQYLLDLGWVTQAIAIVAGLLSLLMLGAVTGIIRTFLRDFGFTLTRTVRGLRRRRGLFTQSDVVMPVHRIQTAIISTGPVRRWFGYYAMSVESLARDAEKQDNHSLAPHARLDVVGQLLNEIELELAPGTPLFGRQLPVLIGGVIWAVVLCGLAIGIIASGLSNAAFVQDQPWLARAIPFAEIALFALGLWCAASAWLSWRMHHYWVTDAHIYIRHGIWNQRLIILPLVKLQSVDWVQGPLTQALGVAKIRFGVAGGSALATHELPWLPLAEAEALRAALIAPAVAVDYSVMVQRERASV